MKMPSSLGTMLLSIYLVIIGLIGVFGISLGQLNPLVPLLAICAGVVLFLGK